MSARTRAAPGTSPTTNSSRMRSGRSSPTAAARGAQAGLLGADLGLVDQGAEWRDQRILAVGAVLGRVTHRLPRGIGVDVELAAAQVGVAVGHLGLAEAHRREQLDLLCDIVRSEVPEDAPLVVAGDFNDWRRRAHDTLEREVGLKEVFVSAYGESAKTFPARFPLLSLDRIYVRNASVHLPVVLPRRPWSHLSDHAPLAAEIHL